MSIPKKRPYNSEFRSAQSQKTKNRILISAKKLFESNGFEKVTIEEIARRAKVSPATIYALFQSKRGILLALMDSALSPQQYELLVQQGRNEKSPHRRLEIAACISRQLYDAEKMQLNLLRGALILDPVFKELEIERERRRYQRQEETIKIMAKEKMFNETFPLSKIRDILWAFTGRDIYRMLVFEQGWSSDEYEQWLGKLLIQTLLDPKIRNVKGKK